MRNIDKQGPLNRPALLSLTGGLLMGGLLGCQPSELSQDETQASKLSTSSRGAGQAPPLNAPTAAEPLPDFASIQNTAEKKAAFFAYLEPMIAAENQRVSRYIAHLSRLESTLQDKKPLHPDDVKWLNTLAKRYKSEAPTPAEQINKLRQKLGPIPQALVLAQAANESAWGTSRFARKGNNLFGQWCFKPGCGITPLQRDSNASHEVASFPNIAASVNSYFRNINSNDSYRRLRTLRNCLQEHETPISGRALSAGLSLYSERGGHYVKELRSMMRVNQLESWPSNWWGSNPEHPCSPQLHFSSDKPDPLRSAAASKKALKQPTVKSVAAQTPAIASGISTAASEPAVTRPASHAKTSAAPQAMAAISQVPATPVSQAMATNAASPEVVSASLPKPVSTALGSTRAATTLATLPAAGPPTSSAASPSTH